MKWKWRRMYVITILHGELYKNSFIYRLRDLFEVTGLAYSLKRERKKGRKRKRKLLQEIQREYFSMGFTINLRGYDEMQEKICCVIYRVIDIDIKCIFEFYHDDKARLISQIFDPYVLKPDQLPRSMSRGGRGL